MANLTVNFNFPKPDRAADPAEQIDEAFDSVAAATDAMDTLFKAHGDAIAGKAAAAHTHSIANVTGLTDALAAKMAATATFGIDWLTDVSGAAEAPDGYLLIKNSGVWIPSSAAAALGSHGHSISEVTGLGDALSDLEDSIADAVGDLVNAAPGALDTLNELAAALGDDASFSTTMTTALGNRLEKGDNLAALTDTDAARDNLGIAYSDLPFLSVPIGGYYWVDDSLPGGVAPPTDDARFRFVLCTADEDGAGEYNEGVLTSESVSGSAPLVLATAVIDFASSPDDGQTIPLINTEGRGFRAGTTAGVLQNDQMQQITGSFNIVDVANIQLGAVQSLTGAFSSADATTRGTDATTAGASGSRKTGANFDSANSSGARTGNETRHKNVSMTFYRRIF